MPGHRTAARTFRATTRLASGLVLLALAAPRPAAGAPAAGAAKVPAAAPKPAAPEAPPAGPPITTSGPVVIRHTPMETTERGEDLVLRAMIFAKAGAYLPTMYYRPVGTPSFYSLPMLPVPGAVNIYAAAVPGIFMTKDIEYYLESYDNDLSGPAVYGSQKVPLRITVTDPVAQPSQVAVRSDPAEAQLLIDGADVGTTPWRGPLQPGTHELLLKMEGFLDAQSTFEVPPGRDLDLRVSLTAASEGAQFAVMSDPAGATVFIDAQELGTTPLIAPCPEGEHILTLEKKGYARAERIVAFSKDRSMELTIAMNPLPPEPALAITTDPPGASVFVDPKSDADKPLGTTPFIGVVPSGEHTLVLKLEGRRTAQAQIMMPEDRDLDLRFTLEEAKTARAPVIAVSSDPSGAVVVIDGAAVGKTPYIDVLAPGDHKVKLTYPGFYPYEKNVQMPEDRDVEVTLALVPEPPPPGPSRVVIGVVPADAEIAVDGKVLGKSPASVELEPGPHTATAKKDGFRSVEERFRVVQGEGMQLKLALSPVPQTASEDPGLVVATEPPGASISIDGRPIGNSPYNGTFKAGKHRMVVSLEGFKPREETFDLPRDKAYELRYSYQLEPVRKSVSLASAADQKKADAAKATAKAPVVDMEAVKSASAKPKPVAAAPGAAPGAAPTRGRRGGVVVKYLPPRTQPGPLILAGAGVAVGAVGVAYAVNLRKSLDSIADAIDKNKAAEMHRSEFLATAGLIGGGLLLGTVAAVWAALPGKEEPPPPAEGAAPGAPGPGAGADEPRRPRPALGVAPLAGGAAVSISGSF